MYWNNELTITMNTNTAATAAMMTAKEILANTSIEEYCEGEFAQFANCLMVTDNEVCCTDEASVRCETYELVLPEILKAIADQGYEFHGNSYWDSTYDKFVDLPVKIITFHRKTLLICWGKIDPINQECLLLQLKKFIALILPNRPYQQKFVAQIIQKKKPKSRCAPIRIGPRSVP